MRRLLGMGLLGMALTALNGCAVHDGNPHMEPVWWPNGLVRASSLQTAGGNVNLQPAPLSEWLPPLNPDGSLKTP